MWIIVQFVLVAVVSVVIAWMVEVINIPSPWRWGIFAALLAFAACSWGVGKVRAALDRCRALRRGRVAEKAKARRR